MLGLPGTPGSHVPYAKTVPPRWLPNSLPPTHAPRFVCRGQVRGESILKLGGVLLIRRRQIELPGESYRCRPTLSFFGTANEGKQELLGPAPRLTNGHRPAPKTNDANGDVMSARQLPLAGGTQRAGDWAPPLLLLLSLNAAVAVDVMVVLVILMVVAMVVVKVMVMITGMMMLIYLLESMYVFGAAGAPKKRVD
ncbi:hypothetical protein E2C01_015259 [Portunus trituberculatus]|uniref:Uncharacterized protein n=1 Tax=Portunus trituberculatus TaxID=210409 RepID=A0A5B7DMC5_PORTR|nr:hypothetical protein [Portunus trituberculatus]